MKKITILAAVVALLGSCAQNTEDTINPNTKVEGRTIYATFDNEEEETKTYVENYKYLRWHAGDEISFFDATTHNNQYAFAGKDGDAEGEFNAVATGEGTAIATTYGVYPYNAATSISEEGVISVELPAIQAYGVNSFGKGANTMVAVGESTTDDKLFFKNACGYLVVKLYNESGATVKNVVLEGNNEEKISGAATITATHAGVPSVTMADTATTSVTIDCGEGVEIGTTAETATEFWFALPEITFEGGITITATSTEGVFEKMTAKPVTITRNDVQPMKALSCKFVIPETWKIYYTATSKVAPYNKYGFGANVVSNTYQDNQGIIVFDSDVTSIGYQAFYESSHLNSITIPNSVSTIDAYAFSRCSNLTHINIPNSVSSIGDRVFEFCSSLTDITIPDNVISIGENTFANCTSLSNVSIGEKVSSIGMYAFNNCSSLPVENNIRYADTYLVGTIDRTKSSYVIKDSTKFIGSGAFYNCSNIKNITIPQHVISIGYQAFRNCSNLANLTLPTSVTSIDDMAFDGCSNLTNINLPIGITSIGFQVFGNCTKLAKITIPEYVTWIDNYAFCGCTNITDITIPKGVSFIGKYAFYGCSSLANVYCKPTTPPYNGYMASTSMFDKNASERKIYVPTKSVLKYQTARYWSVYADDIVGYDFE